MLILLEDLLKNVVEISVEKDIKRSERGYKATCLPISADQQILPKAWASGVPDVSDLHKKIWYVSRVCHTIYLRALQYPLET